MWSAKRVTSVITGAIGAIGVAYLGLSQIWALPYGEQIQQSAGVIVSCLSALLATLTGASMAGGKVETAEGASASMAHLPDAPSECESPVLSQSEPNNTLYHHSDSGFLTYDKPLGRGVIGGDDAAV